MESTISISYGNGGKYTSRIIEDEIMPCLQNEILSEMGDSANVKLSGDICFSTDSFVITPLEFTGGDIGKLAVCGTVNDILVSGAIPKYLSLALILEEGTKLSLLRKIIHSIGDTCKEAGVKVVTGDFKVVEKGKGDGIYINTTGIGDKIQGFNLGTKRIQVGDKIIVTGDIGNHGISLFCLRNKFFKNEIESDCCVLNKVIEAIYPFKEYISAMRDPTRGGLATTLNEFTNNNKFSIELLEKKIPFNIKVKTAAEILGLDLLYSPCEGRAIIICRSHVAEEVVKAIKGVSGGEKAEIIGEVVDYAEGKVLIKGEFGGRRILDKLTHDQLPRIC